MAGSAVHAAQSPVEVSQPMLLAAQTPTVQPHFVGVGRQAGVLPLQAVPHA
ncbi:MAG: hypothetical protein ACXVDD_09530 [Polyangia bacterium]